MQAMPTEALRALGKRLRCSSQTRVLFFLEGKAGWEVGGDAQGMNGTAPAASRWWLSGLERWSSISLPHNNCEFY